jgi:hypothetical protein
MSPVGTGQMSATFRVRLQVASPVADLPETVVVKVASPEPGLRQQAYGVAEASGGGCSRCGK